MITIVSGLPRSGTSLMMQMLQKGGKKTFTDNVRKADENNPRGYFEYEKVKNLRNDISWLSNADGKSIKIIAQLLNYLPEEFEYSIIFMERDMNEILNSQTKLLEVSKQNKMKSNPAMLAKTFQKQINKIKKWIAEKDYIRVLYISYKNIILNPIEQSEIVNDFLNNELDTSEMIKVVEPSLYRQNLHRG